MRHYMLMSVMLMPVACAAASDDLPELIVDADDVAITSSVRIVIRAAHIEDANGNGVIHVKASNVTIEFADGAVLRGAAKGTRPDEYKGYGIRIDGQENVTLRNVRVSGFLAGIYATHANGLTIEDCDASDNRRAYLRSTPAAEDGADWLSPHRNDDNEWLKNYGAAIYVEDSDRVTVRRCRVHHGQNALCIDRVNDAKVYDNDFSFNSGWGIAMWRSSRNVITRNAVDFCVRGYSHGVYNRGQDSAGFLVFEQNNDNIIAENSATHGGDGFFGFAGLEALGDTGKHPAEWYKGRGNSNNLLIANDFSYAPAHGIEMTFSFGNRFLANRMVGNAICGVWGGYSQDTLIAGNEFADNGEMGYGLERGGVNIEHGRDNRIVHNEFRDNRCGVHLWWDPEGDFLQKPWGKVNGSGSTGNEIAGNTFTGDQLAFHFRLGRDANAPDAGRNEVTIGPNRLERVGKEIDADEGSQVKRDPKMSVPTFSAPEYPVFGETRPVGARPKLRGRQAIVMTEWGPWDHASPLVRQVEQTADAATYELHELPGPPAIAKSEGNVRAKVVQPEADGLAKLTVVASEPGIWPYRIAIKAADFEKVIAGTLVNTTWDATFFKWTEKTDPRENLEGWRRLAGGADAVKVKAGQLSFKYGFGGPSQQGLSPQLNAAEMGGDHFGMIATTRLPVPAGTWRFTTTSDDGVRVSVDGEPVIENWAWHGPARDTGTFTLDAAKTVEIVVEHFEIDGFAVLELDITPKE